MEPDGLGGARRGDGRRGDAGGEFGWAEVRILLTTVTISVASLCGLGAGAAWEAERARVMPRAAVGLTAVGTLMTLVLIWGEPGKDFLRVTLTTCAFAAAFSHLSLLSLARLSSDYELASPAATTLITATALVFSFIVWSDARNSGAYRILGALVILAAALTLVIAVLHRLGRGAGEVAGRVDSPSNRGTPDQAATGGPSSPGEGVELAESDQESDADAVARLNEAWNDVYRLNQRERFVDILADDFKVRDPEGRRGGKAEMMSPTGKRKVTFSEEHMELFEHTAVSSGRVVIEHPEGPADQRFVRVWAKRDGRWQAVTAFGFPVKDA